MTKEFELFIHIGTGKTGTTSIQQTLLSESNALHKRGIKYLGLMFEHSTKKRFDWQKPYGWPEFAKISKEKSINDLKLLVLNEIVFLQKKGVNAAVWSNETIFYEYERIAPIINFLKNNGVKITLICYIRNHISWAISAYKQWGIKHKSYEGRVKSFAEWSDNRGMAFMPTLKKWLSLQEIEFKIRNFDKCTEVVEDFFSIVGLNYEGNANIVNESPNSVAMAIWTIYNNQFEQEILPNNVEPTLRRHKIYNERPDGVDYANYMPTQNQLEKISNKYQNDLNELNQLLAEQGQPSLEHNVIIKQTKVTESELIAGLVKMVVTLDREVQALKKAMRNI